MGGKRCFRHHVFKVYMHYMDKATPHIVCRWIGTAVFAIIYGVRVFHFLHAFYFTTYASGVAIMAVFFEFLKPLVPPELDNSNVRVHAPMLPVKLSDEYKPFIHRLPEFKLWRIVTTILLIAFVITFFSVFDFFLDRGGMIFCWIVLFVFNVIRRIAHMIKYKYVPITTFGKKKYGGKKHDANSYGSRADENVCCIRIT